MAERKANKADARFGGAGAGWFWGGWSDCTKLEITSFSNFMWLVIGTILKPLRFFCINSAVYGASVRFTYIEYHEGVVWNFSLTTIHLDLSRTYCASFFAVEFLGALNSESGSYKFSIFFC